jgi:hypothetical protein
VLRQIGGVILLPHVARDVVYGRLRTALDEHLLC